jgi:hypothetical protein
MTRLTDEQYISLMEEKLRMIDAEIASLDGKLLQARALSAQTDPTDQAAGSNRR